MKGGTEKIAWGVGLAAGAVTVIGLVAYFTSKPAAAAAKTPQSAPLTGGHMEFVPGAIRDYKLQVGGTITVDLPPGRSYDYSGGLVSSADAPIRAVEVTRGAMNASTGYSYFALRAAIATGYKSAVVITADDATQMTFNIEVAP